MGGPSRGNWPPWFCSLPGPTNTNSTVPTSLAGPPAPRGHVYTDRRAQELSPRLGTAGHVAVGIDSPVDARISNKHCHIFRETPDSCTSPYFLTAKARFPPQRQSPGLLAGIRKSELTPPPIRQPLRPILRAVTKQTARGLSNCCLAMSGAHDCTASQASRTAVGRNLATASHNLAPMPQILGPHFRMGTAHHAHGQKQPGNGSGQHGGLELGYDGIGFHLLGPVCMPVS